MKHILLFSILFCAIALPSVGELSDDDLNRIRLIVKEEVNAEIENFEKDIKEYINTKNESVEKRLSLVTSLIVGLMALIGIPLVVLTVMMGWRSVKDNSQETKNIKELTREDIIELFHVLTPKDPGMFEGMFKTLISEQEKKIESLTQEIENLKQQRIANS